MDQETDHTAYLRALRGQLARLFHDLNNPLAIMSGNLQLVSELAKAANLDDDMVMSLEDAQTAADQLAERLSALGTIRQDINGRIRQLEAT